MSLNLSAITISPEQKFTARIPYDVLTIANIESYLTKAGFNLFSKIDKSIIENIINQVKELRGIPVDSRKIIVSYTNIATGNSTVGMVAIIVSSNDDSVATFTVRHVEATHNTPQMYDTRIDKVWERRNKWGIGGGWYNDVVVNVPRGLTADEVSQIYTALTTRLSTLRLEWGTNV